MGEVAIGMEPGKFLQGWGTIISKIIESLFLGMCLREKVSEKLHYEQEVN